MHEGALVQEIMDIVDGVVAANGLTKVDVITVGCGPFSGIQEFQLDFYFSYAKDGTVMEDADLVLERDESLPAHIPLMVKSIRGR